jgi:hypothetical protein
MWCCFRLRRRGWGCNCQAYKWSARWGRAAQLYLGEPGGPGWHWERHAVRNVVRLVLTQPSHHRWCRQVSAAAKHLIGSEMRACRFMDNRGLVASPGHAAAYFPSGGQGGDHAQTRCPPDFRSVHGLCPPRLCDEEAGRPSAGGSPGGPLAAWLGVSHAAAPNCMAPGGMPRSQIMPLWRFRCTVVLRGHCLPGIHRPRLRRRTHDQGQPRRHRP